MPRRIINALYAIILKLAQSLKRFPESLLLITATALLLIDANHQGVVSELMKDDFPKLPMILAMGFVLYLCYRMLNELGDLKYRVMKVVIWLTFAGFLVLCYFLLLSELNTVSIIRYIALVFAFIMAFLFIPYLKRKNGFEMYIIKIVIGFLVTYLYAGVLFLGIVAMVFTVDQLFTIQINSKLYFDIWLIAAGVFAPAYFLGGIPEKDAVLDESNYSKILKVLFLYIVMPIISAYTLILYAYFAKVLVTQTWPQGMVSNLVLWYSFITAAIIFLIRPLTATNLWAKRFSSIIPIIIIPLMFMCFWAMGIRIKSYGFTENRYYVFVGALWVVFAMIYWIIKRESWNVVLPVSLAIIAVLTIVGPQSALSVSLNSQSARLGNILEKNNMLIDGKLVTTNKEIPKADKEEISSILRYIDNTHGLKKLSMLPTDFSLSKGKEILGFEISDYSPYYNNMYYSYSTRNVMPIDISDYNFYVDIRSYDFAGNTTISKDLKVDYNTQSGIVTLFKQGKKVYEKDIKEFVDSLPKQGSKNIEVDADKLTFVDRQGDIDVKFQFRSLSIEEGSDGAKKLNNADFCIFIK